MLLTSPSLSGPGAKRGKRRDCMKARLFLFGITVLTAGAFGVASALPAEEVRHHGISVEADGTLVQCVSCHDGSAAHNVSFCTSQCSAATSHSVLKNYPPAGRQASFAPLAVVKSKGIKFDQGRVTCISCHNLRNPSKNHLVMENRGSSLCLTCHIRK